MRKDGGIGRRYTEREFERRFRMARNVFNEVLVTISVEKFFQASQDAAGKSVTSLIQRSYPPYANSVMVSVQMVLRSILVSVRVYLGSL